MKKILSLVVSLTVISGVCAAVLAYVNDLTAEPIKVTAVKNREAAVKAVMPAGVVAIEAKEGFFVGKGADGKALGYAATGSDTGGYGGEIVLMVGFEKDRKTLVCFKEDNKLPYRVLAATETPGLGMKLGTAEFAGQFKGKDGTSLRVKQDKGEIDAITSATITSRAVCRAIADAQKKLR